MSAAGEAAQAVQAVSSPSTAPPPLYVDLDGSVVATDTLWESAARLARRRPWRLLLLPVWLLRGRAHLKARLAAEAAPEPSSLPYRPAVLEYVREERRGGREVVLATAADSRIAEAVAAHLGCFDRVLASDGRRNLKAAAKRDRIREERAGRPFAYLGDSSADLPVWSAAVERHVVAPSARLRRRLAEMGPVGHVFAGEGPVWRSLVRSLRPHQWAKNVLVFLPLFLAHRVGDPALRNESILVFLCYCGIASAGYLLNDVLDVASDRAHPSKSRRPIARGALPIPLAVLAMAVLGGTSLTLSWLALSPQTSAMLALYLALTVAYSMALKRLLLVDVFVLAGLYTHRILTGGVAAHLVISPWLLSFSVFFFVGLAFAKRYTELTTVDRGSAESGRAYTADDVHLVGSFGPACGLVSVLVLCLYINHPDVRVYYPRPELLWLVPPLVLYWITRVWFLAHRRTLDADPVVFAITDRASWVVALLSALLITAAAM